MRDSNFLHQLVGKTLEYDYGSNTVYQVRFDSETVMTWTCIQGDEPGRSASETYFVQEISDAVYFLGWVEADGLGVTQVLDLDSHKIYVYLKMHQNMTSLQGTVALKE
jgi:phenolic acid decarboxylase